MMNKLNLSLCSLLCSIGLAVTLTIATPTRSLAQKSSAQKLPTGEQIFEDYIKASGGREALNKIKSQVTQGTIEIAAAKISGTMTVTVKSPNKFHMVSEIPGIGKQEARFDGKVGWSYDPINGPRVLAGKELAQLKESANLDTRTSFKQLYSKMEVIGIRKVDGNPAYAVRTTAKTGVSSVQYFDVKSKLLVRTDLVTESPSGAIPTENYLSDYRTVDGVKIPFRMKQVVASQQIVMKFTSIKNNVTVDDAEFVKPADTPEATSK